MHLKQKEIARFPGKNIIKHTPEEWLRHNDDNRIKCNMEKSLSDKLYEDIKATLRFTDALTQKCQTASTRHIKERLRDILFWKSELAREVQDLMTESSALVEEKRRLENSLLSTEFVMQIAVANFNDRTYRTGIDSVSDTVDFELPKELELIKNVQEILKQTIEQAATQMNRNRAIKMALECNWSDKIEAEEYDTVAGNLHNGSTNKQFYSKVTEDQKNMSKPEQWAQAAHDIIAQSESERLTSADLRSLITQLLNDISRDLIEKSDTICMEFRKNIDRLEAAKTELEGQLKQTLERIAEQERCIAEVQKAIKDRDDPMKVVRTRLHMRQFRPNMELCKDPAQASLITEADTLTEILKSLVSEQTRAESKLKDLHDLQMHLEKEILLKEETINIDKIQCLPRRRAYPSREQLQGYV